MLNNVAAVFAAPVPPVTNSYESIATYTVGAGGQTTISFSSIPSTFKHLQLRMMVRSTTTGAGTSYVFPIKFNSDSGNNYAIHYLRGNGSAATSTSGINQAGLSFGDYPTATTSNTFGVAVMDILDYQNTSKYKTVRFLEGYDLNGSGQINLRSGLWQNTAAITSIDLTEASASFSQYSLFALYGIKG